jgi:hypothetical protein
VTSTKADDLAIKKINQFHHKLRDSPTVFVSNFFDAAVHTINSVVNPVARDKAIAGLPETLRRNANDHLQRVMLANQAAQPEDYRVGDDPVGYANELRVWAAVVANESQQALDSLKDASRALGSNDGNAGADTSGSGGGGAGKARDFARGAGSGNAANPTKTNNAPKAKASGSDYTDRSRPCVRRRCRVVEPHNNGAVAECQFWCRDPNCAQARTKHMRLYKDKAKPGQTPCTTLSTPQGQSNKGTSYNANAREGKSSNH